MGEHISKVDTEILSWTYYQDEKPLESPTFDEVMEAVNEFSQWENRHHLWEDSKGKVAHFPYVSVYFLAVLWYNYV